MNPAPSNPDDELEAFLDGALDGARRAAFVRALQSDSRLREETALGERIDAALGRMFAVESPSAAELSQRLERAAAIPLPERPRGPRRWIAACGLAAAAAAAIAAVLLWRPSAERGPGARPVFRAEPLAEVYRAAVDDGFEPYYECRDAARFAETFEKRQGVRLKLLPLAESGKMLGLSYLGGLTRDTTAMLSKVEDQPVIVFVDRVGADEGMPTPKETGGLHVFRSERDGLVFYEVSPLAEPRVSDSLAPLAPGETPSIPGDAGPG